MMPRLAIGSAAVHRGREHASGLSEEVEASPAVLPYQPGQCMSSATLIFLGGKHRYFPKECKFGVHQFSFRNPTPDDLGNSQRISAKIAKYVQEMGVAVEFMEVSAGTTGNKITLLQAEELRQFRAITDGDTGVEWTVQLLPGLIYVRGERDTVFGHQKVMLAHSDTDGFQFYAFVEAQGREHQLTKFPSVEIFLNGESSRIDISERCLRAPSGENVVMIVAKLTTAEARAIAHSDSFGVIVRADPDAPVFLGIAAMPTAGAEEKLKAFYSRFANEAMR